MVVAAITVFFLSGGSGGAEPTPPDSGQNNNKDPAPVNFKERDNIPGINNEHEDEQNTTEPEEQSSDDNSDDVKINEYEANVLKQVMDIFKSDPSQSQIKPDT